MSVHDQTGHLSAQHVHRVCLRAAEAAAEYIRSLDRNQLGREYKTSYHDVVTEHDREAERIIVEHLRADYPEARILGEEGGVRGSDGPLEFFVDPIDGTSNFASGLPLFCISIGAALHGELIAGVIHLPAMDMVFSAADGPALLNGDPLTPRATRPAHDALIYTSFPGRGLMMRDPEFAQQAYIDIHSEHSSVRCLGSAAIELAFVAAGWADGACLVPINPWDIAAGFHIVKQAGGSIATWPGTGRLDSPAHLHPAYVACSGEGRLDVLDRMMDEWQERQSSLSSPAPGAWQN